MNRRGRKLHSKTNHSVLIPDNFMMRPRSMTSIKTMLKHHQRVVQKYSRGPAA